MVHSLFLISKLIAANGKRGDPSNDGGLSNEKIIYM